MSAITNKYDFMMLFDVTNGNPNGDPDDGGRPRQDSETGYGIVTDVCLKRKIRNYIDVAKSGADGYGIYIKSGTPLNVKDHLAYESLGIDKGKIADAKKDDENISLKVRDFMCSNFYDIRTFGAVMTSFVTDKLNCGQVKGPVQIGFAKSVDPVYPMDIAITRDAITREEDMDRKKTEMASKSIIPYGLYCACGHVSANLAKNVTGFSEDDLELLWNSIMNMFETDASASRANMSLRKLIIFKHDSELGNAPAYKLFDAVEIKKKDGVDIPSAFSDYEITVPEDKDLPDGVHCEVR